MTKKLRFKMYKAGKLWVTAGVALAALGMSAMLGQNVQAATTAVVAPSNKVSTPVTKTATIVQGTFKAPVYDAVDGQVTGKYLAEGTDWKVYQDNTDAFGTTWYNLGGNQWIKGTGVIVDAIPDTYKSSTRVGFVSGAASLTVYTAPGVAGQKTGQILWPASSWHISASVITSDKQLWYRVGTNQWVKANGMVLGTIQSAKGTATVTYIPGYSIVVWGKADGTENTGLKLPNGTSWLVYGKATVGNHVYYQLDTNQWVDGAYVKFQARH
ncbi:KxYKxGKxW signal peptide domain-containing protein [Lacticaseibacillus saniviri]|nr:KxYKxGKxW signal peptide domain-containing protein [Lacticaseibacillus saniviri]MCG4282430.1 KxYKxGKxW signal peptide domain-containing protein [Lacticaseibacillus saniviri]